MYRFDFSRLTPLDLVVYGVYANTSPTYIYYLADKAALFDCMTLDYEQAKEVLTDFGIQFTAWLNTFALTPPTPDPAMLEDTAAPSTEDGLTDTLADGVPDVFKNFIRGLDNL